MSNAAAAEIETMEAASLGGPGPADPARCSEAAIRALKAVAGPGMTLTTLQLDVSSKAIGAGPVKLRAQTDKRARSIVFVSVEALSGEEMVFRAQGLFGLAKQAPS